MSETEVKSLKTGISLFHEKYHVFSGKGKIIARKSYSKRLYKISGHQVGLKQRAHLLDHRKSKRISEKFLLHRLC